MTPPPSKRLKLNSIPPITPPTSTNSSTSTSSLPTPPDLIFHLKNFPLFSNAPVEFFNELSSKLHLVQYSTHQYIVKSGEPALAMYWILRGSVAVTSTDGESLYAELLPGSFFGEIGILFNTPRTATVVARSKVLLGVLTKDSLNSVIENFPNIGKIIHLEAKERLSVLKKRSNININKHHPIQPIQSSLTPSNHSLIANLNAQVPGPALPPISNNFNDLNTSIDKIDNTISISKFLSNLHIFKSLPKNIMHELVLNVQISYYQPMEFIFQSGDKGRDIYFIVYGDVEVLINDHSVARLSPMMYFGEFAFLSSLLNDNTFPTSRSASIRAINKCELIIIKAETLDQLCLNYQDIANDFKKTASQRLSTNKSPNNIIINSSINNSNSTTSLPPPPLFKNPFNKNSNDSSTPMFKSFSFDNTDVNDPTTPILSMPPLNPSIGSLQSFNSNISKSNFIHVPHDLRQRLSSINQNRRRSSNLNLGPLTDSLFIKVFQLLDLKSLVKCSLVCARWKQLIYLSPNLFNELDLSIYCNEVDDSYLLNIIKLVGSRPKVINLTNCYHISNNGFTNLIHQISISGKILKLILKNNWNLNSMSLMDLSISCPNLTYLDISNCRKIKDDVILNLIKKNPSMNNLSVLILGYCKYLTDISMNHLFNFAFQNLTYLDLTRCTTITDLGFKNLSNNYFINLETLILKDCTFLSDQTILKISQFMPNLKFLNLSFCCMLTDNSITLISNLNNLIELDLSFCGSAVSDSSILQLFKLSKLENISLRGCIRLTREGVDYLLTNLINLKKIDLKSCPRINVFKGIEVEKFIKVDNLPYAQLKIKQNGKIVNVWY